MNEEGQRPSAPWNLLRWSRRGHATLVAAAMLVLLVEVRHAGHRRPEDMAAPALLVAVLVPMVLGEAWLLPEGRDLARADRRPARAWLRRLALYGLALLVLVLTIERTVTPGLLVLGRSPPYVTLGGWVLVLVALFEAALVPLLVRPLRAATIVQSSVLLLALTATLPGLYRDWPWSERPPLALALHDLHGSAYDLAEVTGPLTSTLLAAGLAVLAPFLLAVSCWSFVRADRDPWWSRLAVAVVLAAAGTGSAALVVRALYHAAMRTPPAEGTVADVQASGDGRTLLITLETPVRWPEVDRPGRRLLLVTEGGGAPRLLPGLRAAGRLAPGGAGLVVSRSTRLADQPTRLEWRRTDAPAPPLAQIDLAVAELRTDVAPLLTASGTCYVVLGGETTCSRPDGRAWHRANAPDERTVRTLSLADGRPAAVRVTGAEPITGRREESSVLDVADPGSCSTERHALSCRLKPTGFLPTQTSRGGWLAQVAADESCGLPSRDCPLDIRRFAVGDTVEEIPPVAIGAYVPRVRQFLSGTVAWWRADAGGAHLWTADLEGRLCAFVLANTLIDVHDAGHGALLLIGTSSGRFPERSTPQTGYRVDRLRADGTLDEVVDGIAAYPRPVDGVPWWRTATTYPPLPELDDGSLLAWTDRDVLRIRPDGARTVLWRWDSTRAAPIAP